MAWDADSQCVKVHDGSTGGLMGEQVVYNQMSRDQWSRMPMVRRAKLGPEVSLFPIHQKPE